ncbi:MAG: TadE/TadG family type IV pilus assembly protein [Pirellula sp.]
MNRCFLKRRHRPGVAFVEFAIVAPLFFGTVLASIELCRALMATHSLEEAARSGCRVAVLKGATTSEIDAEVRRILAPVGISNYTVQIQPENIAAEERWKPVSVTINTSFANISWLPLPKYFAAKMCTSSCTLPKEYPCGS